MWFLITPSSFSAGNPIATILGLISEHKLTKIKATTQVSSV